MTHGPDHAASVGRIDVQVLTACRFRTMAGMSDELGADALPSGIRRNHGVLQPCMNQAIP